MYLEAYPKMYPQACPEACPGFEAQPAHPAGLPVSVGYTKTQVDDHLIAGTIRGGKL